MSAGSGTGRGSVAVKKQKQCRSRSRACQWVLEEYLSADSGSGLVSEGSVETVTVGSAGGEMKAKQGAVPLSADSGPGPVPVSAGCGSGTGPVSAGQLALEPLAC